MLLWIDRIKNKIIREYRKQIFKEMIKCHHRDFKLIGEAIVINRNIKLGHNVTIYPGCMFFGDGLIEIGDNVNIGNNTVIYASKSGEISIGNNTVIAAQCYIIDCDHGIQRENLIQNNVNTVSRIDIGEDCWLAANSTVLRGSQIGNGAVIGAKGLVKGKIDSYSINVGVPTRKLKERL